MTVVRIHYDGWLALPPVVRRRLGLNTGDQLEVVPTKDGVLLRRSGQAVEGAPAEEPEVTASADDGELEQAASTRPAKPQAARKPRVAALPATLKARGKRPAAKGKGGDTARG